MIEYKRKLKKFENQSAYESQKKSVMGTPHIVLLDDTQEIIIEDEIDYALEFFTIEALEEGEVSFTFGTGGYCANTLSYSLDNGQSWSELQRESATPTLQKGDKIQFKTVFNKDSTVCRFQTTMPFNAEGNIMSLLYGDDFKDKTTLEIKYCFVTSFKESSIVSAKNLILPATTLTNNCYEDMFNGCTSLTEAPKLPATTLASSCYSSMFRNCTSLTTAPELPATTLKSWCYEDMFKGTNVLPDCSNIDFASESVVASGGLSGLFAGTKVTDADLERILPKNDEGKYCLPVTKLASSCYNSMFEECTSLTTAPELPAITLADYCYRYMFEGCTSLTSAPELHATTLARSCYEGIFWNCNSLTEAPQLPAITLADSCYSSMFRDCTSLTTAPQLLSTTLTYYCYASMFEACTNLTEAPELPSTTLASGCYSRMFYNCTSLTEAPELQATTLAENCYSSMFDDCTSLTEAPELPATTLASSCYESMFAYCTSLTEAPELPATTLKSWCYRNMFNGCSKLNKITMLATDTKAYNCLYNWVLGVASNGTFVKHQDMTSLPSGDSGIPNGWTIENWDNSYIFNGYDYVDLGLPSGTLWATKPIMNENDEVLYFQWGDTEGWTKTQVENGEKTFNDSGYSLSNNSIISKYEVNEKILLDLEDDAVHVHMGGHWHIPTVWQIIELTGNTESSITTQNGIRGRLFTSKINGNSIFIPLFGDVYQNKVYGMNNENYYWSNTINEYGAFSLSEKSLTTHRCCYGLCLFGVVDKLY